MIDFIDNIKDNIRLCTLTPMTKNWIIFFTEELDNVKPRLNRIIETVVEWVLIIFVDDTTIILHDPWGMQILIGIYIWCAKKKGLHINGDKTKIMITNRKFLTKKQIEWLEKNKIVLK